MDFPHELHRIPGADAPTSLQALRDKGAGVPVILGDAEALERAVECWEVNSERTTAELIASALEIDPLRWLAEREEDDAEHYAIDPAPWPADGEAPPTGALSAHRDVLTGNPHDEVFIAVIPTDQPWTLPCHLRIGGWNEMPQADEHAALFKLWSQTHGATVACIADDVIEFTVARPPRTRDEALALAKQHYIYCPDIVHQGVGSVEALAATLLGAGVWYFWWD